MNGLGNTMSMNYEALRVARGTFNNYIFRRADRTKYQQEQQALIIRVQQIFNDSKQ